MAQLPEAAAKLDQALSRLARALEAQALKAAELARRPSSEDLAAVVRERDSCKDEIETLRLEHRRLSQAARTAQENYAAQQVVTEAVAGRLDAAVSQIESLLEA